MTPDQHIQVSVQSGIQAVPRRPADFLKRAFVQRLVPISKSIPQTPTVDVIESVRMDIPHLREATKYTSFLNDDDCGWPFEGLARFYRAQSLFSEAETYAQQRLDQSETRFGADHPDTAASLNNLAGLYESQGKYESAEPLYQRALDIREQQLGADHPDTASSLNNLAVLYCYQARWGEAERLLVRALLIGVQKLGEAHPDTQRSIRSLASLIQDAIEQNRTAELSDHPLTQHLLAQLRTNER